MGNGASWLDSHLSLVGCTVLWQVSVTWVSLMLVVLFFLVPCVLVLSWFHRLSLITLGESVEEALHREVAEEVGLEVSNICYSSSQHWPFPHSSFMLGLHASVSPADTQVSTQS